MCFLWPTHCNNVMCTWWCVQAISTGCTSSLPASSLHRSPQFCIDETTTSIPWQEGNWDPMIFITPNNLYELSYFEATRKVCI